MREGKAAKARYLFITLVLFVFSWPAHSNPHCAKALIAAFNTRNLTTSPQLIESATQARLFKTISQARMLLILADHDGTFKEHEANSELVWPSPHETDLLSQFERTPKIRFFFVTGRPMDWFFTRYGRHEGIGLSANHGVVEKRIHEKDWMPLHGLAEDWKATLPTIEEALAKIPASRLERKLGFVFHWKEAEGQGEDALKAADEIARQAYMRLNEDFQHRPVRFAWSDKGRYFEVLPEDARMGKGEAALRILRAFTGENFEYGDGIVVLTAGDEGSDNEMHSVIREISQHSKIHPISIKIGDNHLSQTTAEYWQKTPKDFQNFLKGILKLQVQP